LRRVSLPYSPRRAPCGQLGSGERLRCRRLSGTQAVQAMTMTRVLVVDDNEDAVDMLAVALEHLGYEVRTAADGRSALLVAEEFDPLVALLDICLPDIDGYELARRLRASRPAIQLVALTRYDSPSDKARSAEAGFVAHLVKPATLRDIQRVLTSVQPPAGGKLNGSF